MSNGSGTAAIDVQLVDGVVLPYQAGAEDSLDDALAIAWAAVVAIYPAVTLTPLYDSVDAASLEDVLDAIRMGGAEPPDLFAWFSVACDASVAEALLATLQMLSFVQSAAIRPRAALAGTIAWGTNPDMGLAFQVREAPHGVDAIHAWQIPGGTGVGTNIADVEYGWQLGHEELLLASITRESTFGSPSAGEIDHGTAVLGIILAGDNGVGMVGIAPDARAFLVTGARASGVENYPSAILKAGFAAGVGGVVLIEVGNQFFKTDPPHGDIPLETTAGVTDVIRTLAMFGITVIEPAGNGGVDLDAFPFLAALQPASPKFDNSFAIMVGGGLPLTTAVDSWSRGSTHGARVDCFAAFNLIWAPSSKANNAYQVFTGTSGASAIIAGAVAAIQSMSVAAGESPLAVTDIRRLVRDPNLGTGITPGQLGGIGSMPSLRLIARHQGWHRILPVGVVASSASMMTMVNLDDDDRLMRREWTSSAGWSLPIPLEPPNDTFALRPAQPVVLATADTSGLIRTITDILISGPLGVHHLWWDELGGQGHIAARSSASDAAEGRDIAAVRVTVDTLVVTAINTSGHLVGMVGDAYMHLTSGLSAGIGIDPISNYRRLAGPAMVSRLPGHVDVVAIEDGGGLHWIRGTTLATIGTGWSPPVIDASGLTLDPRARPGLVGTESALFACAVGTDGLLYSYDFDLAAGVIAVPGAVDAAVTVGVSGPTSIVVTDGDLLVVLAVGSDRLLRAAFRRGAGAWSSLQPVDDSTQVSPLGGVSAVALSAGSVAAFAVLPDGRPCWSQWLNGIGWDALTPV
jgi:hypothetical protein